VEKRIEKQNHSPVEAAVSLGPILVVDDDRTIREIIAETLELEGYLVEQAANGAEALAKIANKLPSLVLLDMRMPVLDGWGVARALRERGVRLPIVVLTAAHNARAWANEIGAIAYLAKPFEDTDLLATVERWRGKFPIG
jgi:two-component system chemotaxis response regulator CheY